PRGPPGTQGAGRPTRPAAPGGPARPWRHGGPGGPGNPSGPGGPTAPSVTWKGREWTCTETGTGSGRMTTSQYDPRAIPGGSVTTMSVSLNVVTPSETSARLTVGSRVPKSVPVM